MKKTIQIITGKIAFAFLIVIIKKNFLQMITFNFMTKHGVLMKINSMKQLLYISI